MNSNVEHEESLVLFVDAHEEGVEIELSTESSEETLHNLGLLHLLVLSGEHWELLFSEDGLGSSLSDLVTEVAPVSSFVVTDGGGDLSVDLLSVNDKILSNVVSEGGWAIEDGDHLHELLPVGLDGSAVLHARLDNLHHLSDLLDSIDDGSNVFLLEVLDGGLGIFDDLLGILDAGFDVGKALGVDGSLEEASNDLLEFLDINLMVVVIFLVLSLSMVLGESGSNKEGVGKFLHVCKICKIKIIKNSRRLY